MSKKFDQLIRLLQQELKLTGTEIAEIIWLAQQSSANFSAQKTPLQPEPEKIDPEIPEPDKQKQPETQTLENTIIQKPPISPKQPAALVTPKTSNISSSKDLSIKLPDVSSIPYPLKIAKALRPLIQYIAFGRGVVLDENATVEHIAKLHGICILVLKQQLELRFDLVLVIDESDSMIFWQRITEELKHLLTHYGIFRNIQTFGMVKDKKGNICLRQKIGKKSYSSRYYSPRKLIDSSGRRLILVVSDCVSEIWCNGQALSVLKIWGKHNAVAIMQMLPESMWTRTGLSLGAMVQLDSLIPLINNRNLFVKEILIWDDVDFKRDLKVPVFNLTPDTIETWSEMVIGKGTIGAGGFVFSSSQSEVQEQEQPEENDTQPQLISKERVDNFRLSSSPIARNLAGLLASAPVINLPIVRLIQRNLLLEFQQIHLAEVFLGGILKPTKEITPDTDPDDVQYHFINEGIRDILLEDSSRRTSLNIIEVISEYFARQLKKNLKEFYALLKTPQKLEHLKYENKVQDFDVKHFATITTKVLKRLGGDYARFAEEIEKSQSELKELPEFSFKVSNIIFIDKSINLQTFNFEVAVIKANEFDSGFTIDRYPAQATGFIEELGSDTQLEMMLIPSGIFIMGSPPNELERQKNESPQHAVALQKFFLGKHPVTQVQWRFVAKLPQVNKKLKPYPSRFKGQNRPVEQVAWEDAVEFCVRLSQYTGKVYRLPSEAEWEYACRAGTTTPFHFGETITTDLANYDGNYTYGSGSKGIYREKTTEVGSFGVANNFGLYDMHGNVWEWCEEHWHNSYDEAPIDGSAWLNVEKNNIRKLLRGGSWDNYPDNCRSAFRLNYGIDYDDIGLRVVCSGAARTD